MMQLRGDIEGLRALAVVAVVINHAFPALLPGGFVGVDIFFVISGYVIGSSLLESARHQTLSFRDFYARRIRRILPPLLVVLIAVMAVGWPLLTAREFAQLGVHVAASGVFGNNVVLWLQAGYFDPPSATKPLLHLWSLGVEEQFYLLLPLVLWPMRDAPRRFAKAMVIAAVLSYLAWAVASFLAPSSGFYLIHARFWELAAGVLLACVHSGALAVRGSRSLDAAARWVSPASLAVLVSSLFLFDERHWPHPLAIVPVLATALLMHVNRSRRDPVLACAPMVRTGGISYAFYLWHWPALVYWRMKWPEAAGGELVVPILLALVLAVATKYFVETPIRFGSLRDRPWLPVGLGACLVVAATAGVVSHAAQGFPARFPAQLLAKQSEAEAQAAWRLGRCFFYDDSPEAYGSECRGAGRGRTVALWGDSHAAHLYPGLDALWAGSSELAQFTAASCPPTLRPLPGEGGACAKLRARALEAIEQTRPGTAVLAAAWRHYTDSGLSDAQLVQELGKTIQYLRARGVADVVVLGPGPRWDHGMTESLHRHVQQLQLREAPTRFGGADVRLRELDRAMSSALESFDVRYVSVLDLLCAPTGCIVRDADGDGGPFYFDVAHFTVAGSVYFAKLMDAALKQPGRTAR